MKTIEFEILRSRIEEEQEPVWRGYAVPGVDKTTILGALLYVQEHVDPSLAFRYGCRYKCCGLCAVEADGRPCLACHTYLRDGMRIAPLSNLPVVRDLVTDRSALFSKLRKYEIYFDGAADDNMHFRESETGARLRACTECLACMATCPEYGKGQDDFAGPFFFVKLAQLDLDPRDQGNRIQQAKKLGLEKCRDCAGGCRCLNGIDVFRTIRSMLK